MMLPHAQPRNAYPLPPGRAMSDAVRDYGRVFQTGSQQRSDARFRRACELVRNGRLGRVHTVTCVLHRGSETAAAPAVPVPEHLDYDRWLGPAPFVPFLAENVYQNLVRSVDPDAPESVHMTTWPVADPSWQNDEMLFDIDVVQKVVGLGREARSESGVRTRQPLSRLLVRAPNDEAIG